MWEQHQARAGGAPAYFATTAARKTPLAPTIEVHGKRATANIRPRCASANELLLCLVA